jgi:hypothetical protein
MADGGNSEKPPGLNPRDVKLFGTEPQNTESAGGGNVEVLKNENTSYFDIPASGGFDIRYSKKRSTLFNSFH